MQWYCWWEDLNRGATWNLFKEDLLLQFGDTSFINHEIELKHLLQTSMVQEYQRKFETPTSMVRNREDETLISHFIGCLNEDIQIEMLTDPPTELRKCFALTRKIEEKLRRKEAWKWSIKMRFPSKLKSNLVKNVPNFKNAENRPAFHNNIPNKYISLQERVGRIKKGLSFNCDDKWHASHKCKHFQLYEVIDSDEDVEEEDEGTEGTVAAKVEGEAKQNE
uniref:Uncharacterized protein n=1 Tax=Nymphaea colorata TaxID=210225 RepID=A0A5K1AI44_9MAGN